MDLIFRAPAVVAMPCHMLNIIPPPRDVPANTAADVDVAAIAGLVVCTHVDLQPTCSIPDLSFEFLTKTEVNLNPKVGSYNIITVHSRN